ncbi:MAG: BTAD domain-containing putative transcriptional regulator [bacterium]|nr:BTAD domain-containing putative transcriptional regulator [bacterium]
MLKRERLLKTLQQNSDKKLLVITAGAGYGKTTLLIQFINELDAPFIFYKIGENDDSLITFISYLIEGIREIYKKFGLRIQSIIERFTSSNINREILMGTFVNELVDAAKSQTSQNSRRIGKNLFIILEDYHSVDKTEMINKAMDYLIQHSPPNIHFIISSRNTMPFSTVKLKAKADIFELGREELKFTSTETRKLFGETYGLNIPASQLREIEDSSVGWVTSLQLMSYLFAKDPKNAAKKIKHGKDTMDYFANEVFLQQSEKIQSFLVRSSILENMTPKSCNSILKIKDSSGILEGLTNKNLFISCVDEQKQIFCYHQLFRDFLLNRLFEIENEKNIKDLHLRAGDYFNYVKDYNDAIQHYLSAKCIDKAVKIIEIEGNNLIDTEKIEVLKKWVEALPDSIINKSPTLLLYRAKILLQQGKWDEAGKAYEASRKKFLRIGGKEKAAMAILGTAFLVANRGDLKKGKSLLTKALKMSGKHPTFIRMKMLDMFGSFCFDTSDYQKMFSAFNEALEIAKKLKKHGDEIRIIYRILYAKAIIGDSQDGDRFIQETRQRIKESQISEYSQIWIFIRLAGILDLRGEFKQSKDSLRRAIKLGIFFHSKQSMIHSLLEMGRLYLMMGNYKISRLLCERTLKLNDESKEEWATTQALNLISMGYLFENNSTKAEEYINKTEGQGFFLITKANIKIETGALKEAENILNKCLPGIVKSCDKYDLTLIYAALAKLYYKKQEEKLFSKYLRKALEVSRESNYSFVLTRLGRIDSSLLQFAVKEGIELHYAETLLKQIYFRYDLVINFFGGLKISRGDGKTEDIKWRTRKAKSLFCYLLANRQESFSPDQLIELFWPEEKISKGRSNLHYTVSRIRDTIDSLAEKSVPVIDYKNGCYEINSQYKFQLDFEEFDKLIKEIHELKETEKEQIATPKYESMVGLYNGDFLPEMYEIWSEEERQYYKEQYLTALEKLASYCLKKRDFEKTLEYSEKIIAADEFNEPAYFMAMRAYSALGKRKEASILYNKLEKILKQELNIEPSAETKALFHKLIENKKEY